MNLFLPVQRCKAAIMRVHTVNAFRLLPEELRSALSSLRSPFFNADFLGLLEHTRCVCADTGWQPSHLWIEDSDKPVFYLPLYEKNHSWGEFVFDQRWAQLYQEHGYRYYPKLVTCVPFTPSVGPRWWCADESRLHELMATAFSHIESGLSSGRWSSWHLLFSENSSLLHNPSISLPHAPAPPPIHKKPFSASASKKFLLNRQDTQFHWVNHDYQQFDDFLARLKSRKRKKLRHERNRVAEQGVILQRKEGVTLTHEDWQEFYACYRNTYLVRGQTPYLTAAFFNAIGAARADQIMMVQARRDDQLVGAALFFHDNETLYGRHWGAREQVDCLHFEACFYQGIEYCIERGLRSFDPGTQGEHKLLRGFEPVQTTSWHWIAHPAFRDAIARHLDWEKNQSERYFEAAGQWLPYKVESTDRDDD